MNVPLSNRFMALVQHEKTEPQDDTDIDIDIEEFDKHQRFVDFWCGIRDNEPWIRMSIGNFVDLAAISTPPTTFFNEELVSVHVIHVWHELKEHYNPHLDLKGFCHAIYGNTKPTSPTMRYCIITDS